MRIPAPALRMGTIENAWIVDDDGRPCADLETIQAALRHPVNQPQNDQRALENTAASRPEAIGLSQRAQTNGVTEHSHVLNVDRLTFLNEGAIIGNQFARHK